MGSDNLDHFSLSRYRDPWKLCTHKASAATVTQKTPPSNPKPSAKTHRYRASRPQSQSPDYFAQFDNIDDTITADPRNANPESSTSAGASK